MIKIYSLLAFIMGSNLAPTVLEINGWVANNATRAERVRVVAVGLDGANVDFIAAATRCIAVHKPTDAANLRAADHVIRTLGVGGATTANQITAFFLFARDGIGNSSLMEINMWVGRNKG